MYHSINTNFFSIHANVCAQKSLKRTCLGFDPVKPLARDDLMEKSRLLYSLSP